MTLCNIVLPVFFWYDSRIESKWSCQSSSWMIYKKWSAIYQGNIDFTNCSNCHVCAAAIAASSWLSFVCILNIYTGSPDCCSRIDKSKIINKYWQPNNNKYFLTFYDNIKYTFFKCYYLLKMLNIIAQWKLLQYQIWFWLLAIFQGILSPSYFVQAYQEFHLIYTLQQTHLFSHNINNKQETKQFCNTTS